jgi:hypothetical protein
MAGNGGGAIHDWIKAGLRVLFLLSAVIAINPQIDGLRLFMAVASLVMAIRLFAEDEISNSARKRS